MIDALLTEIVAVIEVIALPPISVAQVTNL